MQSYNINEIVKIAQNGSSEDWERILKFIKNFYLNIIQFL